MLPAAASNFKSPAQNPELAISIKQAERGKANPILEVKFQYGQNSGREMQNPQKKMRGNEKNWQFW